MTVTFSEACERDIKAAKHVRVAVYPEVKDWLPVQVRLEVSDCPRQLGFTSAAHRAEALPGAGCRSRRSHGGGKRPARPATEASHVGDDQMRDFMKSTLMVVVMVGLAVYLAANVSMGVKL